MNLKALAEHLGVSQTTVSRALNGYPEVSEKTRERVVEAARRLGYRPHAAARRLATGRAGVIGHVLVTGADTPTDPLMGEFLSGAGSSGVEKGFHIQMAPATRGNELDIYRQLAATRQVDGVILSAPQEQDPRIRICAEVGLPFIVHGRSDGCAEPYSHLDIDNEGAFHDAAQLLVQLGHRRIGFVNGPEVLTFAAHRRRGAARAVAEAGLPPETVTVREGAMTEEHGYRSAIDLIDRVGVTAILCSSLIIALGTVRAAGDRGLVVGRTLSVIAHDDVFHYLRPENFQVPLTCTQSPIREAGRRCADRLDAIIGGREPAGRGEVWPVELVVRASIGAG